ncbi:unnamed protein product, partial [Rotaria magnacalcarata]
MCDVRHETLTDSLNQLRAFFEVQISLPPSDPVIFGYSSVSRLVNGSSLSLACQSYGG